MAWLRKLHAWIGLALCLILAALSLSGAALVFKPELRRFASAPTGPAPALTPAALGRVTAQAQAALGEDQLRSVVFASAENPLHEAALRAGGGAAFDGQGRLRDRWAENERPFDWLFTFHHKLFAGETGVLVTGWIGFAALLMTVSGLVLWWPTRRMFALRAWPNRGGRAGWLAAHRDLALMSAPLVAITLLTGTAQALQDFVRPALNAEVPKPPKAVTTGPLTATAALATAQARFPDAALRMIVLPAKPGQPVTVRLRQPGEWHTNGRTMAWLEPATGALIGAADAQAANSGSRLFSSLWPIHAAKLGLLWKVLTLLGGLALAALSLYGGEAYRRRLFRRR